MKRLMFAVVAVFTCATAEAQVVDSGSTGGDGALVAGRLLQGSSLPIGTSSTDGCFDQFDPAGCTYVIPLREPPNHIFNFTTVTIASGVTLKFKPNRSNTPVFILATGDVTIDGVIDVSAETGSSQGPIAMRGGPGGFAGGLAPPIGSPVGTHAGAGLGPGGGAGATLIAPDRIQGGLVCYATCYGNAELQPLVGGSGGGALPGYIKNGPDPAFNGSGGGGALLIATNGAINLNNAIRANPAPSTGGGSGSGGAIRLVANVLTGFGSIEAFVQFASFDPSNPSNGRIRLDIPPVGIQYGGNTRPLATVNPPGQPIVIFPPVQPILRIVSIGGVALQAQSTADAATPDIALPGGPTDSLTVSVIVEATHVPSDGTTKVKVIAKPQYGAGQMVTSAAMPLTGVAPCVTNPTETCARAVVPIDLPPTGVGVISAIIDSVTPLR